MFGRRASEILDPYEDLSPIERFVIDVEAVNQFSEEGSLASEVENKWRKLGVYR